MTPPFPGRINRVREKIATQGLDAALITTPENVRYLSGFTGSSGFVLVSSATAFFITDFRYKSQAAQETHGLEVVILKKTLVDEVARIAGETGLKRVGLEAKNVTLDLHDRVIAAMPDAELIAVIDLVEEFRIVKDAGELDKMREAIRRAESSLTALLPRLKPGLPEREFALMLEEEVRRAGARKIPFDTIVASGLRGALPHGVASDKKLESGEMITIDFGAEAGGYFSDMTRTVFLGSSPTAKQQEIHDTVRKAQDAAIAAVKPGVPMVDIDAAARKVIVDAGYGDYFGHGTGHGVGLAVHEQPNASPQGKGEAREGMVFTIEPGIYIPDLGGVRIEEMVLVTATGCEVLTSFPRELRCL
ncbi:MAG: Xaa-Pro peptidase family protein [Nitrospirota bacterium]|nr:Xaa-Pro peptidase family protein [Nitrospirota bacterium]